MSLPARSGTPNAATTPLSAAIAAVSTAAKSVAPQKYSSSTVSAGCNVICTIYRHNLLRFIRAHAEMMNPAAAPATALPAADANGRRSGAAIMLAARKYAEDTGLPPASKTARCIPRPNGRTESTSANAPASIKANVSECTIKIFMRRPFFIPKIIAYARCRIRAYRDEKRRNIALYDIFTVTSVSITASYSSPPRDSNSAYSFGQER